MSAGALYPTVKFEPNTTIKDDPENGCSSSLDEGAILLEHQVQSPSDEGQNMASPSINSEPTKNKMHDGSSIVDMVMVYVIPDPAKIDTEKEQQMEEDKNKIRDFYINGLKAAGLLVEVDQLGDVKSEVYIDAYMFSFYSILVLRLLNYCLVEIPYHPYPLTNYTLLLVV